MSKDHLQLGIETLASIDPTAYEGLKGLEPLAPGLPDTIVEYAFGVISNRGAIDLKVRELASVSALCAIGGVQPQLTAHLVYALQLEWTESELREALIHLAPLVGLPRTINGLLALADAKAALASRAK